MGGVHLAANLPGSTSATFPAWTSSVSAISTNADRQLGLACEVGCGTGSRAEDVQDDASER